MTRIREEENHSYARWSLPIMIIQESRDRRSSIITITPVCHIIFMYSSINRCCVCQQPENQRDMKMLSVLLPFVLTFTSLSGWKVLNSKAGSYSQFQLTVVIYFLYLLICMLQTRIGQMCDQKETGFLLWGIVWLSPNREPHCLIVSDTKSFNFFAELTSP